ncbi:hypothetical protein [Xylophilus sp. ASV27]|uniref:hypothetical protein n=1 Tax=Xylophilus sp. ASV27 TaxID=2795129 RepID=UPI0018EAECD9|nr:hypothetical protein [Xylophilus sp. ASV27]
MSATLTTFRHGHYLLACSARVLANGRFVPELVITKDVWPTRPRSIAMDKAEFEVEEDAIAAAHSRGIEWVAHYG